MSDRVLDPTLEESPLENHDFWDQFFHMQEVIGQANDQQEDPNFVIHIKNHATGEEIDMAGVRLQDPEEIFGVN